MIRIITIFNVKTQLPRLQPREQVIYKSKHFILAPNRATCGSNYEIEKCRQSLINYKLTEQSLVYGAAAVPGTYSSSTSSDRCIGCRLQRTTMREHSRQLVIAAPLPAQTTVVGRRGFGPRNEEEQRPQRPSFVDTFHTRVHTPQQAAASYHTGLRCFIFFFFT